MLFTGSQTEFLSWRYLARCWGFQKHATTDLPHIIWLKCLWRQVHGVGVECGLVAHLPHHLPQHHNNYVTITMSSSRHPAFLVNASICHVQGLISPAHDFRLTSGKNHSLFNYKNYALAWVTKKAEERFKNYVNPKIAIFGPLVTLRHLLSWPPSPHVTHRKVTNAGVENQQKT